MTKKTLSVLLIVIGCLLIASAGGLLIYNFWDDDRAEESVHEILEKLVPIIPESVDEVSSAVTDASLPDVDTPSADPDGEMPTAEIEGYRYIGKLEIPALGLTLPVMDRWDYVRMKVAPCRYRGTVYSGDLVICGHNYTSHFGRLKNLQPGDAVRFTDMEGSVFRYTVKQVESLDGGAVEEMISGGWDLTLFTCTTSGVARVTVRCSADEE